MRGQAEPSVTPYHSITSQLQKRTAHREQGWDLATSRAHLPGPEEPDTHGQSRHPGLGLSTAYEGV